MPEADGDAEYAAVAFVWNELVFGIVRPGRSRYGTGSYLC